MNREALDNALGNGEILYELNDHLGMIFADWELDVTDDELDDAVHAVIRLLKENNGMTYDDDPEGDRSSAYDLRRTLGEALLGSDLDPKTCHRCGGTLTEVDWGPDSDDMRITWLDEPRCEDLTCPYSDHPQTWDYEAFAEKSLDRFN